MTVSIIIPVYNAEKFLDKAVKSALNQTHRDIQLILVDDGSSDRSPEMCEEYRRADVRVLALSQKNSGPAAARNSGVRAARGEFVLFLDADDRLADNAVELMLAAYDLHRPDMVLSGFSKLENTGEMIAQPVTFRPGDGPCLSPVRELSKTDAVAYLRHFLRYPSNHLISYCWARLYKLSIIRENNISANEGMRLFEDLVFNLEYLKYAEKTVFINENLYVYSMHNEHVSASMGIINGKSLLHDMEAFKDKVGGFLRRMGAGSISEAEIGKEIGHALVHYVIIFLIRSCRKITGGNRWQIRAEIEKLLDAPILRESLGHYSPLKGNSRLLPLLMKRGLIRPLMLYCNYRAYMRYGKLL